MSDKETFIELIRHLPDDVSTEGILRFLAQRLKSAEDWSAEELTDEEWRQFIAHTLEGELLDPREDLYTEADGEPVNGEG